VISLAKELIHCGSNVLDEFPETGFAGPVRVFSRDECRSIMRVLHRSRDSRSIDWSKSKAVSSRLFVELATRRSILDLVCVLLGKDVMLWGVSVVPSMPGSKHPWHVDIETSDPNGKTVSVWIGLQNTNQRSSLQLLARSHRFGVTVQQEAKKRGRHRGETSSVIEQWAREYDYQSRLVKPDMSDGEAILFDGRIWHGSHNTNRRGKRTSLLLQYSTPDTPIRIPDVSFMRGPFRFRKSPKPLCIMVSGTDTGSINRIVAPPSSTGNGQIELSTFIGVLNLPLKEDTQNGWKPYHLFRGMTPNLSRLSCHVSVLSPGITPHPPHKHADEEILIMLSGEASLVIVDKKPAIGEKTQLLRPGSFVYYPANQLHTIRNSGPKPATYLMFKWHSTDARNAPALETSIFEYQKSASRFEGEGLSTSVVFQSGTYYLRKLHCHFSTLPPGAGYPPHIDAHDVAILVLSGTVETLGEQVGPYSVIFYAAGQSHGMKNTGDTVATYIVFEFHRGDSLVLGNETPMARRVLMRAYLLTVKFIRHFPVLHRLAIHLTKRFPVLNRLIRPR